MNQTFEPRLLEELKATIDRGQAANEIMTPQQIEEYTGRFREIFGPDALRALDGEALLRAMHGRQDSNSRCLCYWVEFKNDDEFAGKFLRQYCWLCVKFGVYQRQSDGAWMRGTGTQPKVIALEEAIAQRQRNELLAGDKVLSDLSRKDSRTRLTSAYKLRWKTLHQNCRTVAGRNPADCLSSLGTPSRPT